jgi:hypothetical protein
LWSIGNGPCAAGYVFQGFSAQQASETVLFQNVEVAEFRHEALKKPQAVGMDRILPRSNGENHRTVGVAGNKENQGGYFG